MAWDKAKQYWETGMRKERAREHILRSMNYLNDSERKERRGNNICKFCYYLYPDRVGGCAMTTSNCKNCGNPELYPSTCTDTLCTTCAIATKSCKHCGSKLD